MLFLNTGLCTKFNTSRSLYIVFDITNPIFSFTIIATLTANYRGPIFSIVVLIVQ